MSRLLPSRVIRLSLFFFLIGLITPDTAYRYHPTTGVLLPRDIRVDRVLMVQKLLHYEILERIGEGARSTIYLVRDPGTGRQFALKHVHRDEQKDIRFIEQMEQEFEISRQFNHPNLRKSYELKINRTMLLKVQEAFLIMEWVQGRTLDEKMPTDMVDICDSFIQAAEGLKAMNTMGYVHCDIKPNNILRSEAGIVKIIDFGQSCKIGTVKERIQGTPDFIAPEQVNRQPVTIQTDVFNLGATMYWAVCGKHIPTAYTVKKKGENSFLLDTRIDTPQQLNPKVPPALSNLIMDCISTRASKRPADMDALINRLELAKHILMKERGQLSPPMDANDDSNPGTTLADPE